MRWIKKIIHMLRSGWFDDGQLLAKSSSTIGG